MRNNLEESPRFGSGHWVTIRDTGEHVRVELWSPLAAAYRVHSVKRGLLFMGDSELDEVPPHPEQHLGKYWSLCRAPRCGAPLTPDLPICPRCQAKACTCGRCQCVSPATAARGKRKPATTTRKKVAAVK